jgi:trans-aconitate 2-methyltransferase
MISVQDHWNPVWYAEGSEFQWQITKRILQRLDFSTGERFLDIGCGDGRVTRGIAEAHPRLQVVGLDQSERMISFAQEEHQATGNLAFVAGDIQTFVPDTPFDYIASFWALSWLADHAKAAHRIRTALKDGGRCFLLVPTNNAQLFNTIEGLLGLPPWKDLLAGIPNPVNTTSLAMYRDLFSGCGSVRQERFACQFHDAGALATYVRGWLPHVKVLSKAQQNDFLSLFVTDYNRAQVTSGGEENTVSYDCVLVDGFRADA